ncbi:MAG: MarR family winged helix-turn-helix transcriptional regulator [Microbacterium sp.]
MTDTTAGAERVTDAPPAQPEEPEHQRHTGYLIRRAQQLHVAAWTRIVSTDISSVQYSILASLDRVGQASQRELCDEIDLDRSTIADLVSRMERRGLIERWRDPQDARRNTVALTPFGRAERLRLMPLVDDVQRELTASLSETDRRELHRILRALLGHHA